MNDPNIRNTVLALCALMVVAAMFFLWIAAPSLGLQSLSRERQRILVDADALRIAVNTARELDGTVGACGSPEEAKARALAGDTAWRDEPCWRAVGFHPRDPVIATFFVVPAAGGVEVGAYADLDADGVPFEVRSRGLGVVAVSADGVN